MSDERETYVRHLLAEHRESLAKAEKSERVYAGVVAAYNDRLGPGVTADYKAADDSRLRQAISDGAYYHRRAQVYALAYLVERDVDDRSVRA